jgi:undecaprenyl-diphosphatase
MNSTLLFIFTELASTGTFIALSVITAVFLLHRRGWKSALIFTLCCAGFIATTEFLKHLTHVARPVGALIFTPGYAFPSGHAGGAVFLATVTAFLVRHHSSLVRYLLQGSLILIAFTVGMSRVFLMVHTPFQVAVGFIVGGFFALLWFILAEETHRFGKGLLRHARKH